MANIEEKVENSISKIIENLGYKLYDVQYAKEGKDYFLRIFIEKENGEIYVPAKVRGSKKIKSKLIDLIESHLEENPHQKFALAIADANNLEERNILEGMLKERFPQFTYIIDGHVGAALSCYLGSGLLGVAIQFLPE